MGRGRVGRGDGGGRNPNGGGRRGHPRVGCGPRGGEGAASTTRLGISFR